MKVHSATVLSRTSSKRKWHVCIYWKKHITLFLFMWLNWVFYNVTILLSFYLLSSALRRCSEDLKMNNTLSNTSIKCVRDTSVTAVVFPCLYSILFIVALILNSLAAWIFFSIPSSSTFVVFLKNVVRLNIYNIVCLRRSKKQKT